MSAKVYSIFERSKRPADDALPEAGPSRSRKSKKAEATSAQTNVTNGSNHEESTQSKRKGKRKQEEADSSAETSAPAKKLHPLFGKPRKVESTQEEPIVVPDSPLRSDAPTFAEAERLKRKRLSEYRPYHARWPMNDDFHVEGSASKPLPGSLPFLRKRKAHQVEEPALGKLFAIAPNEAAGLSSQPTFVTKTEDDLEALLPPQYRDHLLLQRIAAMALDEAWRSDDGSELWVNKYAPSCAAEMLGEVSGKSATTLVNWLRELAIKASTGDSPRKKQIRRQVAPKKRQKAAGEFDDFLANSDEEPSQNLLRSPSNSPMKSGSARGSPRSPRTPRAQPTASFAELTNLMLLRGPPGSGKTASVFAAARELDWEVFELSSNTSRTGKALETMFGGMTTNEHLHKGPQAQAGGTSPRRNSFFAPQANGTKNKKRQKAVILDSDDMPDGPVRSRPVGLRQSLILLEEVDVLFPEDKGFWESLVQLVARSRRPFIMTCNDAWRLPVQQLPVQEILAFESPPRDLGLAFLQLVGLAEGHIVSDAQLATFYAIPDDLDHRIPPSSIGVRPLPPVPKSRAPPSLDLRRAMHQLQMFCETTRPDEEPFVDWSSTMMDVDESDKQTTVQLDDAVKVASARSAVDAEIDRRPAMYVEEYDSAQVPEEDIEMGEDILQLESNRLRFNVLPEWAREPDMAATLLHLASASSETTLLAGASDAQFTSERRAFCQLAEVATTVLPLVAPLLPSAAVTTDYLPYLRHIILADDWHEQVFDPNEVATLAPGQARRAMTRSSSRKYARHLELIEYGGDMTPESLAALRDLGYSDALD